MSFDRLKTDFQFALITVYGLAGIATISGFALFRFLRGDGFTGAVDSGMVLLQAATLAYLWRGGDNERAGTAMLVVNTVGSFVVAQHVGLSGVLWSYTAMTAGFLTVHRTKASIAAGLLLAAMLLGGPGLDGWPARAAYVVSAGLVCFFAWMFAWRSAVQHARLQSLATHDALTGLYNRRAMEKDLATAAAGFRRNGAPVAVAVLDIDHFKRVNDVYGHDAGDAVLARLAQILEGRCRATDRVFRYGGEEFVVLLPGAGGEDLLHLIDDHRRNVAAHLDIGGEPVTISIGAAVLQPGEPVDHWLARADAAMYEAKHQGRNRAVLAEAPIPEPARALASSA